jgi:chromosome segregation ATPase
MTTTQELLAGQKSALRVRMAELRDEVAVIKLKSAPLQAQLDAAILEHNAAGEKVAELAAQVDAIEQPALHELKSELADVARAETAIKP